MLPPGYEERSRHFYAWEVRGRGWAWNETTVALEPPFRPFFWWGGLEAARDDGQHPTPLSRFVDQLLGRVQPVQEAPPEPEEPLPERAGTPTSLDEHLILLPPNAAVGSREAAGWLEATAGVREPVAWELVAARGEIAVRLATRPDDTGQILRALRGFFPDTVVRPAVPLGDLWATLGRYGVIQEFALTREFMLPLETFPGLSPDPLLALYATLAGVAEDEIAVVQVLFTATRAPWEEQVLRAVRTPTGEPVLADAIEITKLAGEKTSSRFCAVVLRIATGAEDADRAWDLMGRIGGRLAAFGKPTGNDLTPLSEGDFEELEGDLLSRTAHRSGMLLSFDELMGLVHLPGPSVLLPELLRARERTKPPPAVCLQGDGVSLGENEHLGELEDVRLPESVRLKHCYVVGASGTGKSTLLARMILEDLERGAGVAVLDPHGDLVDEVLSRLPPERIADVVLLDPAAENWAAGWNLLGARSDVEREMLASDVVGVFRRLATSWGDQMTAVLANAIQAVLDALKRPTLLELRRFLADAAFRKETLAQVSDPYVAGFWREEFPLLKGHPQGPILTRLDGFLRSRLIRRVVVHEEGLDLRGLIDSGGVLLAKLAQGAVGGDNAALLGSLLVSSIHRAALSRVDERPEERRPFFLYLDEFHEVATPSMASLFTGARKFRLAVTVAHQDLYQLHAKVPDVERAVLGNAETRIVFRVGEEDSRTLARGFSTFTEDDLLSLKVGEAIARAGGREGDFNLATAPLARVPAEEASWRREAVEERMRERFPLRAEPRPAGEPVPEPEPLREEPRPPPSAVERPAATPRQEQRVVARAPERPGRGGPEHTYLQELIARFAQDRGFRVNVEEELPGGGRVDVALHRGDLRVACEIAVESSVVKELGNLRKCLAAGFDHVVAVSRKEKLKRLLEEALGAELSAVERERVSVFSPEEFLSFLGSLPREEREDVRAGWKVKVRVREEVERGTAASKARGLTEIVSRSLQRLGRRTEGE